MESARTGGKVGGRKRRTDARGGTEGGRGNRRAAGPEGWAERRAEGGGADRRKGERKGGCGHERKPIATVSPTCDDADQ